MSDPTLITDITPYAGFTLDSITERLLRGRGMTLDADTGGVLASATEQTEAYDRVRRAFALMHTRFPGIWTIQLYSVVWTAADTRLALPANLNSVVYVNYNGIPMLPITREKFQALSRSEDLGGDFKIQGIPSHYYLPGVSDEGVDPATDYRLVIELIPHPTSEHDTKTLEVAYNSKAPALPRADSDDGAKTLPIHESLQEWALRRAQELWGADNGDRVTAELARDERSLIELDIEEWVEGNTEYPQVALPEYPTLPEIRRD